MLNRYSKKEMRDLWSEENRFKAMLEVEILACFAWSELGEIPYEDALKIRQNASFSISRILEIEKETKHDIVAFTRNVSETLGAEKKWIHYGLTSTDVVDTAYGYIYKQVNTILENDLLKIIEVLKNKALQYKDTVIMGRTHGIHAEVTTFGLKFALWYEEMKRNLERFKLARIDIEVGKISGAVGTFANTPPFVEEYVCANLKINYANISTQTLQRDRHAYYLSVLALIGTSLEKMATEIRHLQRSEVNEVQEYFSKNQKGSSAMPHKKNPIGSENITGCARVLRGYMISGYENVTLWHERDISHSSAERIIMPDATMLLDYMLQRFTNILDNLFVNENNMLKNIDKTIGLIFSQRVLLLLIDKGLSREKSYDLIQPLTLKAWDSQIHFKTLILENSEIMKLINEDELDDCFDPKYHLKNVDAIYRRLRI